MLLALACAAGVLLRLLAYVQRPSFWIDEAMLGLNIILRSPTELLRPLDFEQVAPIGFLMLTRTVVAVFGAGEQALRAVPLLGACAVVILFPFIFAKSIDKAALLPATMLIAFSPLLIRYGNELKPYSTDALVALGILGWTLARVSSRQPIPLARLALIGCVAILLSIPSIFVLIPAAMYATWVAVRARDRRALVGTVVIGSVWLAEVLALRRFIYEADAATTTYLTTFWEGAYLFARHDLGFAEKLNLTSRTCCSLFSVGSTCPQCRSRCSDWLHWRPGSFGSPTVSRATLPS